jgi:hypothetical protein
MLLWTQTSMHAAQRLYSSAGFVREPGRDFHEGDRRFLFFAADLHHTGRIGAPPSSSERAAPGSV